MTPLELANLVLSCHLVAVPFAAAAAKEYGDRSERFKKSLDGTDAFLIKLQNSIAEDLGGCLTPLFASRPTVIGGESAPPSYVESVVNPVGSEAYRAVIRAFTHSRVEALVAYEQLSRARNGWCLWARVLSWASVAWLLVQTLLACLLVFVVKFQEVSPPRSLLYLSLAPGAICVAVGLLAILQGLRHHDVILENRRRHDAI